MEGQNRLKEYIRFFGLNLVGNYAYAMGVQMFTAPHHIAPGGVTGVATIMNYLWGFPIGLTTFLINVPLLVLAWLHISKGFTIRTAISTAMSSVCIDLLVVWMPQYKGDALLASLFGGALMGVGLAAVYISGSTTGGTSIVSALLQKRFHHIPIGKLLMGSNLVVVVLSVFAYGNIDSALYAALTIITSSLVMDNMIYGSNTNRVLFIISERSDLNRDRILVVLHRGTTLLNGETGYKHEHLNIIFCVVSKAQFYRVQEITRSIDPHAFIVGCTAGDVLGKGFKHVD